MILKPAHQTPLSALYLAKLSQDILPPGVLNVLPGGADIGEAMIKETGIAKISFTGSTNVGRVIATECASTLRPSTLELGGKNPLIVCADADLDKAVEGIVDAAFGKRIALLAMSHCIQLWVQ